MTADRRAALVEKVARAMAVCEGYSANNNFIVGSFEDSATAAIDLIRAETLEEAARVADKSGAGLAGHRIRALKETHDDT